MKLETNQNFGSKFEKYISQFSFLNEAKSSKNAGFRRLPRTFLLARLFEKFFQRNEVNDMTKEQREQRNKVFSHLGVEIPRDQHERIRLVAKEKGLSISQLVRRALREYLAAC